MISGHGTIADAVEATRAGAFDFLEKPLGREKVLLSLKHALEETKLREENRRLREMVGGARMIGASPAFERVLEQATMAARSDARVLLEGESGTGKELLAAHIHAESPFAAGPFVKVNCAAIPTELIESELFGHEKGAFTGATSARRGKFELADGGTLFLDEVGDLHGSSQAKLLRVLQEGEFHRVGGEQSIRVSVRVIAATNRDLSELVRSRNSARICIIACASCRCVCRRCGSVARTSVRWPNISWANSARAIISSRSAFRAAAFEALRGLFLARQHPRTAQYRGAHGDSDARRCAGGRIRCRSRSASRDRPARRGNLREAKESAEREHILARA